MQKILLGFQKDEKPQKKNNVFDEFNFLDETVSEKEHFLEDLSLKPPVLFTKPRAQDLKEMVKTYFELKKIF